MLAAPGVVKLMYFYRAFWQTSVLVSTMKKPDATIALDEKTKHCFCVRVTSVKRVWTAKHQMFPDDCTVWYLPVCVKPKKCRYYRLKTALTHKVIFAKESFNKPLAIKYVIVCFMENAAVYFLCQQDKTDSNHHLPCFRYLMID